MNLPVPVLCPKCQGWTTKKYNRATDKLDYTCVACGYTWSVDPVDRPSVQGRFSRRNPRCQYVPHVDTVFPDPMPGWRDL